MQINLYEQAVDIGESRSNSELEVHLDNMSCENLAICASGRYGQLKLYEQAVDIGKSGYMDN